MCPQCRGKRGYEQRDIHGDTSWDTCPLCEGTGENPYEDEDNE